MINLGDIVICRWWFYDHWVETGPYIVRHITKDCVCPECIDTINKTNPPDTKKHVHLSCSGMERKRIEFYLNGYDEKTLQCVTRSEKDYLTVIGRIETQASLF